MPYFYTTSHKRPPTCPCFTIEFRGNCEGDWSAHRRINSETDRSRGELSLGFARATPRIGERGTCVSTRAREASSPREKFIAIINLRENRIGERSRVLGIFISVVRVRGWNRSKPMHWKSNDQRGEVWTLMMGNWKLAIYYELRKSFICNARAAPREV